VRVQTGGLLTGWLPVFAQRAGTDSEWNPPSVDEQCLVLSPSGEPAQGFVLVGLYSDAYPAPDDSPTRHRRAYRDGAVIEYDTETHQLRAELPAEGTFELIAQGGSRIVGPVRIEGTLHTTEAVSTDSTVHAADAISTDATVAAVGAISTAAGISAAGALTAAAAKIGGKDFGTHGHGGIARGNSISDGPI
jgi:phage baseplate assembly protein V